MQAEKLCKPRDALRPRGILLREGHTMAKKPMGGYGAPTTGKVAGGKSGKSGKKKGRK